MRISPGMRMEVRREMRVLPAAQVVGRLELLPGLLRPSRPLRHGIMPRYIEGDRGREARGVPGMSTMVLEGSCCSIRDVIRLSLNFFPEDTMLCPLPLGKCLMSRSGGRLFGKWVLELMVSLCPSSLLLSPHPARSDCFAFVYQVSSR